MKSDQMFLPLTIILIILGVIFLVIGLIGMRESTTISGVDDGTAICFIGVLSMFIGFLTAMCIPRKKIPVKNITQD